MKQRAFGQLLKAGIASIAYCEQKTAVIIEDDLGQQLGVAAASIQRYKAGYLPPEQLMVERLAYACVQRGLMGREWLRQFLQSAGYPTPAAMLDRLFPPTAVQPNPQRIYHNLPAPTYSQFVMRSQAFAEVIEGLSKRSSAVLIIGMGGNGKTSLAREVAEYALHSATEIPRFAAAIWLSDKGRQGSINLSLVLDEIARTLDYPGFTLFEFAEKRREVEQLLRRQRVLICVDNFETITDGALVSWLLDLPEPSKALITTREYRREFRRGGWPVELRGMLEHEAHALLTERLKALRIDQFVQAIAEFDPLVAATGGNPMAMGVALGLLKYKRQPLHQVIADLRAAQGELFADLFERAWLLLDDTTRRVVVAAACFPASVLNEALAVAADVHGIAFERAIERLVDLSLLDIQQANLHSAVRYTLHPLVRAFVAGKQPEHADILVATRQRWAEWYRRLAEQIAPHWFDLQTLAQLDPEHENLRAVAEWLAEQHQDQPLLTISSLLGYYYYVRGLWQQQKAINQMRLAAARRSTAVLEEALTLLNMIRVATLQDDLATAETWLGQAEQLAASLILSERQQSSFLHAKAMIALAHGRTADSRLLFERIMAMCAGIDHYKYYRARNWFAECLLLAGDASAAQPIFQESLAASQAIGYQRSVMFCQVRLARILLQQQHFTEAAAILQAAEQLARTHQNRRDLAAIQQTTAEMHRMRGDLPAAQTALQEAIDLFERLGMRRELAEARQVLG
jgi:hypothetical protein